jgi:hypothetical protein
MGIGGTMKKLIIIALLFSGISFAGEVEVLDRNAVSVINVLNKNIESFHELATTFNQVVIHRVSFEKVTPQITKYMFYGAEQIGDMRTRPVILEIIRTRKEQGPADQWYFTYEHQIIRD